MLKRRSEVLLAILASLFVSTLLYPRPKTSYPNLDTGSRTAVGLAKQAGNLSTGPSASKVQTRTDGHTSLALKSMTGEYIGGGKDRYFNQDNATFADMENYADDGVALTMHTEEGVLNLHFASPGKQQLRVGHYEGATRRAFHSIGEPGLEISGWGRGCNRIKGKFEILEIAYGPKGPTRFAADFVQYGEEMKSQRLEGSLRFHSLIP